jgi:hypothetical protein
MKWIAVVFSLFAGLVASGAGAQATQALTGQGSTPVADCPSTATLDLLVKAINEEVSGPANKDRTCFRALFAPNARLMPLAATPDGGMAPHILTVDDWIAAVSKRGDTVLSEQQVKVTTETYGHLAHLWSTYELKPSPDAPAVIRGINSIQAAFDGKQWKIVSILWQAETSTEKVPEKYLP